MLNVWSYKLRDDVLFMLFFSFLFCFLSIDTNPSMPNADIWWQFVFKRETNSIWKPASGTRLVSIKMHNSSFYVKTNFHPEQKISFVNGDPSDSITQLVLIWPCQFSFLSHYNNILFSQSNEWLVGLVSVLRFAIKILIHYNFSFERVGICHWTSIHCCYFNSQIQPFMTDVRTGYCAG